MIREIRLSHNLKFILKEKEISLSTMARRAEINVSTLHNYLEGILPKHIKSLLKVAESYDLTIDELLFCDITEKDHSNKSSEGQVYKLEITLKDERT